MPTRLAHFGRGAWSAVAHSLSGRILLLTVLFVMLSVVLIYFPLVARYHHQLLLDRVRAAELAILPFTEAPGEQLSENMRLSLASRAGVSAVVLKARDRRHLFLVDDEPAAIQATYDVRDSGLFVALRDVARAVFGPSGRSIRILAKTELEQGQDIEVIASETAIREALSSFSWRALTLALFISGVTSVLIFLALHFLLVRPMKRLTSAMIAFRANPEDPSRIIAPSPRSDEIGIAEKELSEMQRELYGTLQHKARLAALGAAVAKIQHDLRNILTSAQMASDRLAKVGDPAVQSLSARIVASLDRAATLATATLQFGKAEERMPMRRRLKLSPLVNETATSAIPDTSTIEFVNAVPESLEVDADPEHLFRVLLNLARNAREALDAHPGEQDAAIRVEARRENSRVYIEVSDTGPGIPEKVRERLFLPFAGSARPGGSGLGLAIARELIRAHGGDVTLVKSDSRGTRFRIEIPDRTIQ
ncbi:MAG: sensor histidine kinase [Alphaproteobacteria bacterium]